MLQPDHLGRLPAHLVVRSQRLETVRCILDAGPMTALARFDDNGSYPLHLAAHHSCPEVVRVVCERYPDALLVEDAIGRTPLSVAFLRQDIHANAVMRVLIEGNPGQLLWPTSSPCGRLPLHIAFALDLNIEKIRMLVELGPEALDIPDESGRTAFVYALLQAETNVVQYLMDHYGKERFAFSKPGNRNWSLLACLVFSPPSTVRLVLERCPNLLTMKVDDEMGGNVLHWTVALGSATVDAIALLVQARPSAIQEEDNGGRLPIHYAVIGQASRDVLAYLIQAFPLSCAKTDLYGFLPMHYAMRKSDQVCPKIVQMLVSAYPEAISTPDHLGCVPLLSGGHQSLDVLYIMTRNSVELFSQLQVERREKQQQQIHQKRNRGVWFVDKILHWWTSPHEADGAIVVLGTVAIALLLTAGTRRK